MIGSQDLLVGLAIVLFFFGAKRLPEIARSLGTSMKEFKKGVAGDAEASDSPKTVVLQDAVGAGLEPLPPVWRVGPEDTDDWVAEPSLNDGRTPPLHPRT